MQGESVPVVGVAGWPVTVGVVSQPEQTLRGTGARVYAARRDWLGVVTGISAALTKVISSWMPGQI